MTAPYRCLFCGTPTWLHPCYQEAPLDCCHESDHGEPDGLNDSTLFVKSLICTGRRIRWNESHCHHEIFYGNPVAKPL